MTTPPCLPITKILATSLTLFGLVACSTQTTSTSGTSAEKSPTTNETPTTFNCVSQGSGWATIVEKGNAVSKSPLFTWNTTEFGPEYTPKQRCNIVSDKLTESVKNNGGKLSNLDLKTGKVQNNSIESTVVCVVNNESEKICTLNNMLFTLNQKNAKTPNKILAQITDFTKGNANSNPIDESDYPERISLEALVKARLTNIVW
jgi:hypothetical protein